MKAKQYHFSSFAQKLGHNAAIVQLMDDLGKAMASGKKIYMLGGGNPGQIPQVEESIRKHMQTLLRHGRTFENMIGNYSSPQGEGSFIEALTKLLNDRYGWGIGPENIALTNGSQTGSFMLFNLFAGDVDGTQKYISLPITPEYIGYVDQGISKDMFVAKQPSIELLEWPFFKYHVDLKQYRVDNNTAAICFSRPTNPTGNVITDDEVTALDRIAQQHSIPLIIDNAYGQPFPGIIFSDVQPRWNENIVLLLSLSKIGMPGVRTGIIVANESIIRMISNMNAILSLCPNNFGPALAQEMIRDGEILHLSQEVIKPFYQQKAEQTIEWIKDAFDGVNYRIHIPEGALFLWLWFEKLPISSQALYQRLKARGVLIIPGQHFFPGLDCPNWQHQYECIRLTYSQGEDIVRAGIQLMGEELKAIYSEYGVG